MLHGIVFDLDDTLFLERDYVRSGYRAAGEFLRRTLGRSEAFEDWLWQRFLGGRSRGAMENLNQHFKLGLDERQMHRLIDIYRTHVPDIQPIPGMVEFLGRLRDGHVIGLLGDGYLPGQRLKLQALGIERFFDAVLFTEELGRDAWKPSPRGFEWMADTLKLPHQSLAYVSDNVGKDFVAPNALGWRTIQFVYPGQLYCDVPPAPGGQPQRIARTPGEIWEAIL